MNELIELMQKFSKENGMRTALNIDVDYEGNIVEIYFSYIKPSWGIRWKHEKFDSAQEAIAGIKALIELKKATA